jgi:tetratricopeptide (TPR) repeat protein
MAVNLVAAADSNYFVEKLQLADQHEQRGEYGAAEKLLIGLLREAEVSRTDDLRLATVLNNLGSVYHSLGESTKAEGCYRRAIQIYGNLLGAGDPRTIRSSINLGSLYVETRQTAKAARLDLGTLVERQESGARNDLDRAKALSVVGGVEKLQGNFTAAERHQLEVLAILEKLEPNGVENMRALNNLGAVYAESGRKTEALACYRRGLEIAETLLSPDHPGLVTLLANVGAAHYFALGPAQAEPYYRRALVIGESSLGRQHPLVGQIMLSYSAVLERINRKTEAKQYRRDGKAILAAAAPTESAKHSVEFSNLVQNGSKSP